MEQKKEADIRPVGGPEATVTFKLISDHDCFEVRNPEIEGDEGYVFRITGYDVRFEVNPKHINNVESIAAASEAMSKLFTDIILEELLGDKNKA